MLVKHVIIAAAGKGSRLSKKLPKCMVEVEGKKIIEYQLNLLKEIEDVSIIVGYKKDLVIDFVKKIRPDIRIIINDYYDKTTTLQSFYMGCCELDNYCLIMDADIIFNKDSFKEFILDFEINQEEILGISNVNTEDAIYTKVVSQDNTLLVSDFSRHSKSDFEWANIAIVHSSKIENKPTYCYEQFSRFLPLRGKMIDRLEIDTMDDYNYVVDKVRLHECYKI